MPLDQTADEPAAETAAKTRDSYTYDAATMTITGAGGTYTFSALTPAQKDAYELHPVVNKYLNKLRPAPDLGALLA